MSIFQNYFNKKFVFKRMRGILMLSNKIETAQSSSLYHFTTVIEKEKTE